MWTSAVHWCGPGTRDGGSRVKRTPVVARSRQRFREWVRDNPSTWTDYQFVTDPRQLHEVVDEVIWLPGWSRDRAPALVLQFAAELERRRREDLPNVFPDEPESPLSEGTMES